MSDEFDILDLGYLNKIICMHPNLFCNTMLSCMNMQREYAHSQNRLQYVFNTGNAKNRLVEKYHLIFININNHLPFLNG